MPSTTTARRRLPLRAALTALAVTALGFTTAACQSDADAAPAAGASASALPDHATHTGGSPDARQTGAHDRADATAGGTTGGSRAAAGDGSDDRSGGQAGRARPCRTRDVSLSLRTRSQAGGYLEIKAVARRGVTCTLPTHFPSVSFGSRAEAGPAEQALGLPVTLSAASGPAYAGVNPKTTGDSGGVEFDGIFVSLTAAEAADSVHLTVPGGVTEDEPIATNWHTDPADAVPGDGLDS